MMKKNLLQILTIMVMALPLTLAGQTVTKTGTVAAQFLKIAPGARSISMGGAFVSIADDASALWWNPAGIARQKENQVLFNHSEWLADISYDYLGAVYHVSPAIGSVGMSITYLSMAEMERTTEAQPDGNGEFFSASSFALGLTYSRMLSEDFSFGATFKYVQEDIFNMSASNIAFDIGMLYETPFWGTRLGMAMSNYGGKMKLEGDDTLLSADPHPEDPGNNEGQTANLTMDAYDMPLIFRVGISNELLQTDKFRVTAGVDAVIPNDNLQNANAGVEVAYDELFFIRAGHQQLFLEDAEGGLTLGIGVDFDVQSFGLALDYAYEDYGRLDNIQKYSLILKF
jgi:hypothetical protein